MSALAKPFLYLAFLSFLIGVVVAFTGPIMGLPAETFARGCSNLALLAIGIGVVGNDAGDGGGGMA